MKDLRARASEWGEVGVCPECGPMGSSEVTGRKILYVGMYEKLYLRNCVLFGISLIWFIVYIHIDSDIEHVSLLFYQVVLSYNIYIYYLFSNMDTAENYFS